MESERADGREDQELVALACAGDLDAFTALVNRHQPEQFRIALRLTGDRADAHDALQSAFVRAHRHLATCAEPAKFGGWLGRIVVNECRTLTTRRARREQRFVRDEAVLAAIPSADGVVQTDWHDDSQQALQRLPDEMREAFVLKYVEERSYEEMAELTGSGVSALKMRVKRACERLRSLLEVVQHG